MRKLCDHGGESEANVCVFAVRDPRPLSPPHRAPATPPSSLAGDAAAIINNSTMIVRIYVINSFGEYSYNMENSLGALRECRAQEASRGALLTIAPECGKRITFFIINLRIY